MDIPLHRGKNDPALHFLGLPLQKLFYHLKGRLGSFRAHKKLRQENRSRLKTFSHLVEGGDQVPVDQIQCRCVFKSSSRRFRRALGHPPQDALPKAHGGIR